MIRIAYVIDYLLGPNGGTEGQLLSLINGLDKTEFKPYLVYLHETDWTKSHEFPFETYRFDVSKLASLNYIRQVGRFMKLCKRESIDIVQVFFYDSIIFGTLGARLAGCPAIVSSRRNLGDAFTPKQFLILGTLGRLTTHYLSNSKAGMEMAIINEKADRRKFTVIYNGHPLERYDRITGEMRRQQRAEWHIGDDEILIGMIGYLRGVKNIDLLIKAAGNLCKIKRNIKFAVVGWGPEKDRYQEMINDLGIEDKFRLAGGVSDVIPCLAAFDIGVLTSRAESFSNSIIEYMASGLPVVASNVGGNPEAIEHGNNGLLFTSDNQAELESCLMELIENPESRAEYGRNARDKVDREYSLARYITDHENFYRGIAAK